ncbi:MAG: hypothetical protein ABIO65_05025 [Nitrospiria bacterium]
MKHLMSMGAAVLFVGGLGTLSIADEGHKMGKGTAGMSKEQQIKLALSAGPDHIVKDATVMVIEGKQLVELKPGNGAITCIPWLENNPEPDPVCMDQASTQWVKDFLNGLPKPTNTEPGIAYMGRGGYHWEKDGKVVMDGQGAKRVKEPPHWMLIWPFDANAVGFPVVPTPGGAYMMFEGTPYAHMMIYQDPHKLK